MDNLLAKIERLEYHQKLLLGMIRSEGHEFDRLIIKKNLDENEVKEFRSLCEYVSKEMEVQKAEKFVFYAPLFNEFVKKLNPKLNPDEVVNACLKQNIYTDLMNVLQKNL
ncbi:YhaI family protein [Lederbergia panacisoli]|uniref:YhaI family protein n=1 Tax=Lederbergia panacisoli TaxID=1255251 RepID=UPI00214B5E26|nr:YhaI family protein [Lederbergia panacisoli]MCR2821076.1 YhaI family protein [Lederbergia panacisoli]